MVCNVQPGRQNSHEFCYQPLRPPQTNRGGPCLRTASIVGFEPRVSGFRWFHTLSSVDEFESSSGLRQSAAVSFGFTRATPRPSRKRTHGHRRAKVSLGWRAHWPLSHSFENQHPCRSRLPTSPWCWRGLTIPQFVGGHGSAVPTYANCFLRLTNVRIRSASRAESNGLRNVSLKKERSKPAALSSSLNRAINTVSA